MTTQPAPGRRTWPPRAVVLGLFLVAAGLLLLITAERVPFAAWFMRSVALLLLLLSLSAFSPRRRHWAAQALIGSAVLTAVLAYARSTAATALPAVAGALLLAVAGVIQWTVARADSDLP